MNPDYTVPPEPVLIPAVSIVREPPADPGLPATGADPVPLVVVSVMLFLAGVVAVWMARRVRKAAAK